MTAIVTLNIKLSAVNEGEDTLPSSVFPLSKGHRLHYHFDFGDDWLFEITCRRNAKPADPKVEYPRLVQEEGRRPKQDQSEEE